MKLYPYWLKTSVYHIREFFWPLLDKSEDDQPTEPEIENEQEIFISKENMVKAYDLKAKISASEEDRRASVESKASLFISTISVTTSVVVAANALTINNNENLFAVKISVIISFILTVYTVRTVWFSVKALGRKAYHVMDFEDINIKGDEEEYHRALILSLSKKTKQNEEVINDKVNNLVLAQEYYKRAIVVICIYAFSVLIFCLFFKKPLVEEPLKPRNFQVESVF